jgi:hypothetical protein
VARIESSAVTPPARDASGRLVEATHLLFDPALGHENEAFEGEGQPLEVEQSPSTPGPESRRVG